MPTYSKGYLVRICTLGHHGLDCEIEQFQFHDLEAIKRLKKFLETYIGGDPYGEFEYEGLKHRRYALNFQYRDNPDLLQQIWEDYDLNCFCSRYGDMWDTLAGILGKTSHHYHENEEVFKAFNFMTVQYIPEDITFETVEI